MDKRMKKIREQSKENNYTETGKPRARQQRLQQRGAEKYIDEQLGEVQTPAEAKKNKKTDKKKLKSKEGGKLPDRVRVGSGFQVGKLREKQKQKQTLETSQDVDMRGEILEADGEKTKLGAEITSKMQEMKEDKEEKEKFEIHKDSKNNAINNLWNISRQNEEVIERSYNAFGTEFGLYASIPMLCKGEDCVYAKLYPELHGDLAQPGERCPVEVAIILSRYENYKEDLGIDIEDAVDMSILRDVIDYDVQIVRAENKVAIEGDFVKDVVVGVSNTGVEIMQEQISQASEYKQKIQNARNKALNLLNSTRKDKAGEKLTVNLDPSSYTRELLQKANDEVIDVDFEEVEEEEDVFANLEIIEDEPYMQKIKGVEDTDINDILEEESDG